MQRRTFLHAGLVAGAALTLAGCGFRLRGFDTPGLAIAELALAGSNSEFYQLTEERLTRAGTQVHDRAAMILNLGPENFREHRAERASFLVAHHLDIGGVKPLLAAIGRVAIEGFGYYHALGEQALEGFVNLDEPQVAHQLGEESRVKQVQDGVLNTTDVEIDG